MKKLGDGEGFSMDAAGNCYCRQDDSTSLERSCFCTSDTSSYLGTCDATSRNYWIQDVGEPDPSGNGFNKTQCETYANYLNKQMDTITDEFSPRGCIFATENNIDKVSME